VRLLVKLYPSESTQQAAAQLPWSPIQLLLNKYKGDPARRDWYATLIIENGWSRSLLSAHINSELYEYPRQSLDYATPNETFLSGKDKLGLSI